MSKLLRVKDWILLGLGVVGEFSEDLRLVGDLVPRAMELKYGFIPPNFKKASYMSSISRLISTHEISKNVDAWGQVTLELTSLGVNSLKRKFPIFTNNKWDGSFMMAVFDIPEKDKKARQVLRNKLKELGFGMLQESVWISPYHFEEDLKEFLDAKGYASYVFVLKIQKLIGENIKELVIKIWGLEKINNRYLELLNNNLKPDQAWKEYLSILSIDPFLPDDLLPINWPRNEVIRHLNDALLIKNTRPLKKLQSK